VSSCFNTSVMHEAHSEVSGAWHPTHVCGYSISNNVFLN
jgi:hypothetical protein